MNLASRSPIRKPLISLVNKRKRLRWCREHRNWTIEDWKCVLWSDESAFSLYRQDGRVRVWRQPHESMDPSCLVRVTQGKGGNVKVWGAFSFFGTVPLKRQFGRITHLAYLDILNDMVLPHMQRLFPNGNGLYQDDNATIHRHGRVMNWFQDHNNMFQHIVWPPNSPDINPIEHLWDELDRKIRNLESPPSSLLELEVFLKQEWMNIEPVILKNLVESMPRRVLAVIKALGGPTNDQ